MRDKALKILSVMLAIAVATVSCLTCTFADTVGSITVTVKYEERIITSGVLTLYKVADRNSTYTTEFANCGLDISDLESSSLPWLLWQWAKTVGVSGITYAVGADGTVIFSGLEEGIYLVVPTTNPTGYDMEPSLVPVPLDGDYDVEVVSKIEPTVAPPDNPPSTTTTTVDEEPGIEITTDGENVEGGDTDEEIEIKEEPESEPEEDTLPQTGQLNYPIPIMAGAGAVCVAAGLILTQSDKKK